MSYSKKRIDYNNKWPDEVITFSAEIEFKKLLSSKGLSNILRPIHLPLIEDFEFQRLLSFKIDIYDQLPYRPDIAFDLGWRTYEAYCTYFSKTGNWTVSKTWKILNKVSEDILENQFKHHTDLNSTFEKLISSIPLQATEYLVRRLFEESSGAIKSQQNQIVERTKESLGTDLYEAIENKYSPLNPSNQRKAGMLLQLIISGQQVQIGDKKYKLSRLNILKLIVSGVLYTYRNERFHGDAFSPFKSSKTRIKTYAHAYFSLLCVYFFISQLIYKDYSSQLNMNQISQTLDDNLTRFNLVFESHRKK